MTCIAVTLQDCGRHIPIFAEKGACLVTCWEAALQHCSRQACPNILGAMVSIRGCAKLELQGLPWGGAAKQPWESELSSMHCLAQVLERIRGTRNVDEELEDIKAACRESNKVTNPWAEILKRQNRPQLFAALTATFFQQWTGINTVIFYGARCRLDRVSACGIAFALRLEACQIVMRKCLQAQCLICLGRGRHVPGDSWTRTRTSQRTSVKVMLLHSVCIVSLKSVQTVSVLAAPQLFISLGTGQRAALLATIVTGVVNHFATYVSLWAADSFGRRLLFLEGGVQMLLALVRSASLPEP